MYVDVADPGDVGGFLMLAAQVEHLFGPMVDDPGFHDALARNIRRRSAYCVRHENGVELLGGLLLSSHPPVHRIGWLAVAEPARGQGIGTALVDEVLARHIQRPFVLEVATFPEAAGFYERLGFTPATSEDPARLEYRLTLPE